MDSLHLVRSIFVIAFVGFASAQKQLVYFGPKAFQLSDDATFGCAFVNELESGYVGTLSIANEKGTFNRLAKIENNNSFIYENAPEFIKDRLTLNVDELAEGKLSATVQSIQIGDDREWRCNLDFDRKGIEETFKVRVYSIPDVYVVEKNMRFALNKKENGTVVELEETLIFQCQFDGGYPMPLSIEAVSEKTGEVYSIPSDQWNTTTNGDGTLNITADLFFTPELKHHSDSFICKVVLAEDLDTEVSDPSNTILIDHDTTDVDFTISPNPANDGDEVTMMCNMDGYPTQSMVIVKADGSVMAETRKAKYQQLKYSTKVSKSDMGMYSCLGNKVTSEAKQLIVNWSDPKVTINAIDQTSGESTPYSKMVYNVAAGKKFSISCSQNGHPEPVVSLIFNGKLIDGGRFEAKEAQVKHSGEYRCESSIPSATRYVDVVVEIDCNPVLKTNVAQTDEGISLRVSCVASGNPACSMKLSAEEGFDAVPDVKVDTNEISHFYGGLKPLKKSPTFYCSATNVIRGVPTTKILNATEDSQVLIPQPIAASGMSPGIVVVIILLVTFAVIGIPYGYYRCCKKAPADGSHTKGAQLDSVEVEKLDAVEQVENEDHNNI